MMAGFAGSGLLGGSRLAEWLGVAAVAALGAVLVAHYAPAERGAQSFAATAVGDYCVDCHDPVTRSGGVVLDPGAFADVGAHAELFERVVRKLRSRTMPPPDSPRPSTAAYERVTAYLEAALDRAAAASPNPGNVPQLKRLTRTEYRNTIRDLLALENLPAEMNYELLLPADNSSSGFDNIAELLFVSPAIMERYLEAARKISRLAVGDPGMPVMVNIHRLPLDEPQDDAVAGLPLGTRGGLMTDSYFPLDAEYVFRVELERTPRERHELEITIDGVRVAAATIGIPSAPGGAPPRRFELRVPVDAGPHRVGVTFAERTAALDENTLRPQRRSRGPLPAIELVTISGPHSPTGPGDTPSRDRLFVCRPQSAADEAPCAREILATLARRAYRRPVDAADIDEIWPFYEAGAAERGFEGGIQRALERVLVSPQFLYRIERIPPGTAPGTAFDVSPIELASRLSYFLWSSMPDDELLAAAESGELADPRVLARETARMLADPRADALVDNFASQWLFLRDVAARDPDPFLFRDYDESLREAFVEETKLFVASVFRSGRSVLELITANYTFVNERLAEHYGIPHVRGSRFRRVELPAGSARGGLLGHGSILTLTSYPTRTSPVLRGKFVLDNLLASPPPPPPPDVPALVAETAAEDQKQSLRDALAAHRADPQCASCHAQMDPIGFAFEQFDAIGRWRETEGGLPIETASELPDGTVVDGIDGVRKLILADPERFVGAFTEKLLMYALGRNVQYYDLPTVRAIVRKAAERNHSFAALVEGIVMSVPFRQRLAPAAPAERTAAVVEVQ
jgi:mono/diheme cytochrome c family protein